MPTCVALGCGARSDRGVILKTFPRKDLKRRQLWIDRVNRPEWTPSNYSALCQLHFDKDQWELPREDGKRKLKNNAVPSIFSVEHPSNHNIIAKDHAYCLPRLRKLYDNCSGADEATVPTIPIEHVKVEVDEDFVPECSDVEEEQATESFVTECCEVEEEQGTESFVTECYEMEEEQVSERFVTECSELEEEEVEVLSESLECTPDICWDPESGDLEPMETVQCEEDEPATSSIDPSNDPLAISADDVVRSNGEVPNFPHSTKYVFVPNRTAFVRPGPLEVKGEPAVKGAPTIKVRSPNCLFKPTSAEVDTSPKNALNPASIMVRKSVVQPFRNTQLLSNKMQMPPANITALKMTGTNSSLSNMLGSYSSLSIMSGTNSSMVTIPEKNSSLPILSGLIKRPTSVSIIRTVNSSLPPPLRLLTKKTLLKIPDLNQNLENTRGSDICVKEAVEPLKTSSAGENKKHTYSDKVKTFILKNGQKIPISVKFLKPFLNKKAGLHKNVTNVKLKGTNEKKVLDRNKAATNANRRVRKKNYFKSIQAYTEIENIFLEHDYSKNVVWRPLTLHGLKLKSRRRIPRKNPSSCNLQSVPNQPGSQESTQLNESIGTTMLPNYLVDNPPVVNPSAESLNQLKKLTPNKRPVVNGNKEIELYECNICNVSFLTSPTFNLHKAFHKHPKMGEFVAVHRDRSGTESKNSHGRNTVPDKNKNRSKNMKAMQARGVNKSKRKTGKGTTPFKYENSIVSIPNLYALKKFQKSRSFYSRLNKKYSYSDNFISKKGRLCKKTKLLIAEDDDISANIQMNSEHSKPKVKSMSDLKQLDDTQSKTSDTVNELEGRDVNKEIVLKRQPIVLIPKLDINTISSLRINNSYCCNDENIDKPLSSNGDDMNQLTGPDKKTDYPKRYKKDSSSSELLHFNKDIVKKRTTLIDCSVVIKDETKILRDMLKFSDVSAKQEMSSEISSGKMCKKINNKIVKGAIKTSESNSSIKNNFDELSVKPKTSSKTKDTVKNNTENNTSIDYKCTDCNKRFAKSFQLRRHIMIEHKVVKTHKPFICRQKGCGRAFETTRELDKHFRTHRKSVSLKR